MFKKYKNAITIAIIGYIIYILFFKQEETEIIYTSQDTVNISKHSKNGYHSEWSDWTACSKECGGGIKSRTRSYTQALNGGIDLSLDERNNISEEQICNNHECPENGYHSEWSDWSLCSKECGGGIKSRTRTYTPAKFGGVDLSLDERNNISEEQICNNHECPENGYHSEWSEWSECNKECGGGIKSRTRVYTPAKFGGVDLSLDEKNKILEEQICNNHVCPVNGYHSEWSEWSECNKPCGNGTQSRTRTYTPAKFGGVELEDKNILMNIQLCNTHDCPSIVKHNIFLKNEERAENNTSYSILSPNNKYMLTWNAGLWFIIYNKQSDGSWYPSSTLSVSSEKKAKSLVVNKYQISLISTDGFAKTVASSSEPCSYSALTDNGDWIFVREDKTTAEILKNGQKINITW